MIKRLIPAGLACALLAAGACSGGDPDASDVGPPSSTAPTVESTASTESSCVADGLDPSGLESLIADAVPSAYTQQPDDYGDTGPSDLEKAARDDSGDDAEDVLRDLRFVRGYQRLWQTEAEDQLIVFLYEFCEESGASDYLSRTHDSFAAPDSALEAFTPTGVPTELGFRGESNGIGFVTLPTQVGRYLVQVVSVGDTTVEPWDTYYDRAATLLLAQIDRL